MSDDTGLPKPPISLIPKRIFMEQRLENVYAAILRYQDARMQVPKEWNDEYEELHLLLNGMDSTEVATHNTYDVEIDIKADFSETGACKLQVKMNKNSRVSDVLTVLDMVTNGIYKQISELPLGPQGKQNTADEFISSLTIQELSTLLGRLKQN